MISSWSPISLEELELKILEFELDATAGLMSFWELIKIAPEKWQEPVYGNEGGGFWVVAVYGRSIIWYNDIEEGFNISEYQNYGHFTEYWCGQSDLMPIIDGLLEMISKPNP